MGVGGAHVGRGPGLTSSTRSSSSSLNTVPLIWLGFSAVQLNTGNRNLVLMGFLIRMAAGRDTGTCPVPTLSHLNLVSSSPGPPHPCAVFHENCHLSTLEPVTLPCPPSLIPVPTVPMSSLFPWSPHPSCPCPHCPCTVPVPTSSVSQSLQCPHPPCPLSPSLGPLSSPRT